MSFCSERGWHRAGYCWHSSNHPHQTALLILQVASHRKGAKLTQIIPLGPWTLRADEKLPLSLLWHSPSPTLHGPVLLQAIFSSHVVAGREAGDDGESGMYQERESTPVCGLVLVCLSPSTCLSPGTERESQNAVGTNGSCQNQNSCSLCGQSIRYFSKLEHKMNTLIHQDFYYDYIQLETGFGLNT